MTDKPPSFETVRQMVERNVAAAQEAPAIEATKQAADEQRISGAEQHGLRIWGAGIIQNALGALRRGKTSRVYKDNPDQHSR